MKLLKQKLIVEQVDRKLQHFQSLVSLPVPASGWINTIRLALNMSLRQLGQKLGVSAQAVKGLETSEKNGTITLQSLHQLAKQLDMKLVYGFVPLDGSLEKLIARKATETAKQIVSRASVTMKLEDQENAKERLLKAVDEKARELKEEMPKYIWD